MIYPNLRAELARKGWSVERLANVIGIPKTTLNNKLYGKSDLKYSEALKIKNALGVDMSLEELFMEKEVVV